MSTEIAQWFATETANLPALRPGGWAVMGFPLWGEKYFDRFERYCLASMLAPENRAALDGATFVLWTNEATYRDLVALVAQHGFEAVVKTMPAELMGGNKYQLLAVIERLLIRTAAKNGRGYTGVFPDFIVSERYFPNVRRLSSHVGSIAHSNLTATAGADFEANLAPFRQHGPLVVRARELGDIGWRHLHAIKQAVVTDAQHLPSYHLLIWRGADYARIHSPHSNAAWISADLCRHAPKDDECALAGWTLDGTLPSFLGPRAYHVTLADDLAVTDLYDQTVMVPPIIPLVRWPKGYRQRTAGSPAYLPYFSAPTMVPLHYQPDCLTDGEISRQVRAVIQTIER